MTTVIIGADHLGVELKNSVTEHLKSKGHEVVDIGVNSHDPVDYPDVGRRLAERVAAKEFDRGILICGTGLGMAITANKVPGVRAASIADPYSAERAIASNNAQVICMGQRTVGPAVANMLVDIWLENEFGGGGSTQKVAKMDQVDADYKTQRQA